MRCKRCKACKTEGFEYPEEYCCIGVSDDEINEDRNGDLMLALRQREMPIKYQMGFLLTKQTTGVKQSYLFHMPDILVCIYRVHVGKLFLSV